MEDGKETAVSYHAESTLAIEYGQTQRSIWKRGFLPSQGLFPEKANDQSTTEKPSPGEEWCQGEKRGEKAGIGNKQGVSGMRSG